VLLASLMILALVIALCRSVGANWIGELLESADEPPAHASAGTGPRAEGSGNPSNAQPHPDRESNPDKKEERPSAPDHQPWKVGPPEPPSSLPEVEPAPTPEKKAPEKAKKFQADDDIRCVSSVAILSDHQFVFRNGESKLFFWDPTLKSPHGVGLSASLTVLAYATKNGKVACGTEKGDVYLFAEGAFNNEIRDSKLPNAHNKAVTALAFSADGKRLLSADEEGKVVLRDTGREPSNQAIPNPAKSVRAVALSTKGDTAFWGGADGRVHAWDIAQGSELELAKGPTETITSLVLSPDDRVLYAASGDGSLWRWDLKEPNAPPGPERLGAEGRCLAISPDGRFLLSGQERKINVWDTSRGKLLHTLEGNYPAVFSLAFSADGRQVVSGHAGGVLILWPISLVEQSARFEEK
jgi:WD40 repeat protein